MTWINGNYMKKLIQIFLWNVSILVPEKPLTLYKVKKYLKWVGRRYANLSYMYNKNPIQIKFFKKEKEYKLQLLVSRLQSNKFLSY